MSDTKLTKCRLKNFRCFDELELNLPDDLAVIVGGNGSGKTAILEALAIAAGTFFNGIDSVKNIPIKNTDAKYSYYHMGTSEDVQQKYPVSVWAQGVLGENTLSWERTLSGNGGKTTIRDAANIILCAKDCQKRLRCGDVNLILPVIAYYGTGRMWDYHREKQKDFMLVNTRTNGYIDCLDGSANVKLMMKWFQKMTVQKYQRVENGEDPDPTLSVITEAMAKCISLASGYDGVKIQYNMNTKELDVLYTETSGNRMKLPLNQLSDGYKCTISMVADIAYRMAVLNPQLSENILAQTDGVVLIDEIDLHLHPRWQQRILGDLRTIFPKVQFIVSTHAPAVINTVKRENIIITEPEGVYSPSSSPYGKDVNTVMNTIMEAEIRPEHIKKSFEEFYSALDNMNLPLAESILVELESVVGDDDPECASCRMRYELENLEAGDFND